MFIDFNEAKMRIETKRNAAVDKELRQQDWFLESEAGLKRKQDSIVLLLIFDFFMGIIAFLI